MRTGMPIPDAIQDAPNMAMGLEFYMKAFLDLDSSRSYGLAMGPIPWTAVDRWADRYGVKDPDDFDELVFFISHLDAHWIGLKNKNGKS